MAKLEIPTDEFDLELVRGNVKKAMADAGAKSGDFWSVPPSMLRVIDGFNGRIRTPAYLEHLARIKDSIRENGYYQDKPLAGFVAKGENGDDVIYVTEGHTRFEAVRELIEEGVEIERVPVVVKPNGTTMEDLTFALVTSNEGRPFTTFETALMVKRLVGMGVDEATIAKRLGFKAGKAYVDDLLSLAGAPKAIRDMVIAEKISATLAIQELKKHGAKAVDRLKAAVAKAEASGKKKASAKHLDKPAKQSKKAASGKDAAEAGKAAQGREIDSDTVLYDAKACGLLEQASSDVILAFAATLLNRFGVEVYIEVEEAPAEEVESVQEAAEEDPADDL
jgi:Predicted transcriptional regulators